MFLNFINTLFSFQQSTMFYIMLSPPDGKQLKCLKYFWKLSTQIKTRQRFKIKCFIVIVVLISTELSLTVLSLWDKVSKNTLRLFSLCQKYLVRAKASCQWHLWTEEANSQHLAFFSLSPCPSLRGSRCPKQDH